MILVTGGTGFLGSYLIRYLVRDGFQVRALKRSNSNLSLLGEATEKVEWVEGDVLDIPSLEDAFAGVDKVYHAASIISHIPSERRMMMKVNVEGTANIVNMSLAKGVKKLLYVSSTSALQKAENDEYVDETIELEKNGLTSSYGISKFLGEREVWRGIAEGLNSVIVNPSMLIGAGRWSESSVRIFDAVAKGQLFYPAGSNGYADVRDAAKIIIHLMESSISGERFIISAENRNYRELIFEIADILHVRRPALPLMRWLIPVGRTVDWMRSKITGSKQVFTSDVASITSESVKYNNLKIKSVTDDYHFIHINKSIAETIEKYKESISGNSDYAILPL